MRLRSEIQAALGGIVVGVALGEQVGVVLQAPPLVEVGQVVGAVAVIGGQVEGEVVVAQHVGDVQVGGAVEAAAGVDAQADRGQGADDQLLEGLVLLDGQRQGRGLDRGRRSGGQDRRHGAELQRALGQAGGGILLEQQEASLVVRGDDQLPLLPGDLHRKEVAGAHIAVAAEKPALQVKRADIVGPDLVGAVVDPSGRRRRGRGDVVETCCGPACMRGRGSCGGGGTACRKQAGGGRSR